MYIHLTELHVPILLTSVLLSSMGTSELAALKVITLTGLL